MSDNIKNFSDLKNKFKDDPSYKDKLPGEVDFNKAVIGAAEILALPDEDNTRVISPILNKSGLMEIFGERGIGKSYFTFSLAWALSTGGNFLKFKVPVPQKVAYFDGEMGHTKLKPYIQSAQKNQGESFFPENLDIISCSRFADGTHPQLENYTHEVYDFLTSNGYNGVIIDSIATCTEIDENNPKEWKPLQKLIIRLRNAGLFVIFVAHAGLDKGRARGITHREDVLNTVISLQRAQEVMDDCEKLKVSFTKHRDFSFKEAAPFHAVRQLDGSWLTEEINLSTYELVIQWFLLGATGVKIAEKLDISPPMVSKYKTRAVEEGRLRVNNSGKVLNVF